MMSDEATCAGYKQAFPFVHMPYSFPLSEVSNSLGEGFTHTKSEWRVGSSLTRSRKAHNLWTIVASGIVRHRGRALYGSCDSRCEGHCKGTRSRGLAGRSRDCSPTRTAGRIGIVSASHDTVYSHRAARVIQHGDELRSTRCSDRLRRES